MTRRTGDECDQCLRQIRFAASRVAEHPEQQFCSDVCAERYRRDVAIWNARLGGESEREIAARLGLRREVVGHCLVRHQARTQRTTQARNREP